ncbi:MAG TPA: NAD(P)/FAD-dependent oxidoreductase [Nocardioidaceae bacterium]|nr:NAD(P)/FAD-dependent oxidoreductase [Nocardioidaceae bacterium]
MDLKPHPRDHPPADLDTHEFDVLVVGAGSTGENVASRAGAAGLSVAVIESELVGGECSYWACMPSKALLRSPEAVAAARSVDGARQAVTGSVDVAAVLQRRDGFASGWDDGGQVSWAEGQGLALVRGAARLTGERAVEVRGPDGSQVTLTARHAVALCTGSEAALPPIDGLAEAEPWTARAATSAQRVPDHLLVVGGGVVGVEMATAWSALGSRVTVLEMADRLLSGNEAEAGRRVQAALVERGVDVRLTVEVTRVRREGGTVTVELGDGSSVTGSEILVATGRRPRTGDLGLEQLGLSASDYLQTDDSMTVQGVDGNWLYAAGDCTGRALLTHMGKYQARVCGDVIAARAGGNQLHTAAWSKHAATADHAALPQVAFTDPQVASVGPTEAAAKDAGTNVDSVEFEIGDIAGAALFADDAAGWAKLVIDADRQVLVGATFVGPQAGELLHAATIAVVGEVPLSRLWHAVPSYPTISEVWLRLLETYGL